MHNACTLQLGQLGLELLEAADDGTGVAPQAGLARVASTPRTMPQPIRHPSSGGSGGRQRLCGATRHAERLLSHAEAIAVERAF